jgi:glycerophosphoryl diester phosphodiesterase
MKAIHYSGLILMLVILSCSSSKKSGKSNWNEFSWEGHRGARGLMPENTIPSMKKAIDLGANVLELDVLITRDNKVVVSHDPYFNDIIATTPEGNYMTKKEANERLLYQLDYDSIRKYDVGMKPHPEFPKQQKVKAYKPLLSELIDSCEAYAREKGMPIRYNVEIKSGEAWDGTRHPDPKNFVDMVVQVISDKKIIPRTKIQSFDVRPLQYLQKTYPDIMSAYLVGSAGSVDEQFKKLGFKPRIYSPHYGLVTKGLIDSCHRDRIKVVPWTVNTAEEMKRLIDLGVDGIISDYPDLFAQFKAKSK